MMCRHIWRYHPTEDDTNIQEHMYCKNCDKTKEVEEPDYELFNKESK